ncbi:MAG: hypothetical protein JXA54_03900 [Candidatus Heimdallarchaeota archaeon]|nr:hypothetical protein [Candidatus Heimdallarchaeota archaeon]
MYKFIKRTLVFLFGVSIFFILILRVTTDLDTAHHSQLVRFQKNKIDTQDSISILFIGDSSLGNSINAQLFTKLTKQTTSNCALSGRFGYAGTYNMLKYAYHKHKELKNVVVMQIVDIQSGEVRCDGYVRSMNSLFDFIESLWDTKFAIITDCLNFIYSCKFHSPYILTIENDYPKQTSKLENISPYKLEPDSIISDSKMFYLKKIKDFCNKNKLNLIYTHGPKFKGILNMSEEYIKKANNNINELNVNLISTNIPFAKSEIGDDENHISPIEKDKFTTIYYNTIKDYLNK